MLKQTWPHKKFYSCFSKCIKLLSAGEVGCSYCGGLGHRIADCPKLQAMQTKQAQGIGRKDYLAHNSADWQQQEKTDTY